MKDPLRKKSTQQKWDILRLLRARGQVSRQQISRRFGIALPTVSSLVNDLQAIGFVTSGGRRKSAGGRPPEVLQMDPDFGTAIGAEISLSQVAVGLIDARGELSPMGKVVKGVGLKAQEALQALGESISALLDNLGQRRLLGIGIGVSGIIEEGNRVSRRFPGSSGWDGLALGDWVESRFSLRPILLNDVAAAALAEAHSGDWSDSPSIVYLHLGEGIAAGIIANGKVYRGVTGNAGEVGHVIVAPDGPICYCGNRGCLESVASPRAIVTRCAEALEQGVISSLSADRGPLRIEHILAAARAGDSLAMNLLDEAGGHVGQVAANLVNVLNPQTLVLWGPTMEKSPFLDAVRRAFNSGVLPALRERTAFRVSSWRENACVAGAGLMVLDDVFEHPENIFNPPSGRP